MEVDTGMIDINTDIYDVKILSDGGYICAGANASNILTGDSITNVWMANQNIALVA